MKVFINGGGNTFKLLYDIKRAGMFEAIREYLENGGVSFGGSAGAIILQAAARKRTGAVRSICYNQWQ